MTLTFIMTPKIWSRPILDITIVLFCILFTILTVNTDLENYPTILSVTLLIDRTLFWKKSIYYFDKKTKFHNKDVVGSRSTRLNLMRRSSIWKLSRYELRQKALRISYLGFTAWWLNQQGNNSYNFKSEVDRQPYYFLGSRFGLFCALLRCELIWINFPERLFFRHFKCVIVCKWSVISR